MAHDDGLRVLFHTNLRNAMWVAIESGSTQAGIPDSYFCFPYRIMGWVEHKAATANAVTIRPHQVAWHEQHWRNGGRSFIAVRKRRPATARVAACDDLYLYRGGDVRALCTGGLAAAAPLGVWSGGPKRWKWAAVEALLTA